MQGILDVAHGLHADVLVKDSAVCNNKECSMAPAMTAVLVHSQNEVEYS